MKKFSVLILLLSVFVRVVLGAGYDVTLYADNWDTIDEVDNGASYMPNGTFYQMGRWLDDYDHVRISRSYFEFDFAEEFPADAIITTVEVNYTMDGTGHQFKLTRLTSLPETFDAQWEAIGDGDSLQTFDYGNRLIESDTLKTLMNELLAEEEPLILGVLSMTEDTLGAATDFDMELFVHYETALSLVARNDLYRNNGGQIGVGIYPLVPTRYSSPHAFLAMEGQRVRLAAYDNQSINGKTWFFNDTEASGNKSKWEKIKSGGEVEPLGNAASFTTDQLSTDDDGAEFIAYLKHTDYTTSGTMSEDEEWFTPVILTNNVTIASGVTLTVTSGTTVRVADYKQLIVNGTLDATDATFTASNYAWSGIRFNSGSDGSVHRSNLYKCGGSYFIYIYNASPTIGSCTLDQDAYASYGIKVAGSNADPVIYFTDIFANEHPCVQFTDYAQGYYSGVRADVNGSYAPVFIAQYDAHVDGDGGGNTFRGGGTGLHVSDAVVLLSGSSYTNYWCDTNGNHIAGINWASVFASYNDFPDGIPVIYNDGSSGITVSYHGNSNSYCGGLSKQPPVAVSSQSIIDNAGSTELEQGWASLQSGDIGEARAHFQKVLDAPATEADAHRALRGLAHTLTATRNPALLQIFHRLAHTSGPLQAHAQQALVHGYRVLDDKENALAAAETLYRKYPGTEYDFFGRQAAMYLLWELGRPQEAAQILAQTTSRTEWEAADLRILHDILQEAGADVPSLATLDLQRPPELTTAPWNQEVTVVPNPYDISAARQDPAWQLQFLNLPAQARIQIYDVAGARIRTFTHQAGADPAGFGVLEVPAGVYLYVVEELDGASGTPTGKRATGKFVVVQ